jgi:hypothetical protein
VKRCLLTLAAVIAICEPPLHWKHSRSNRPKSRARCCPAMPGSTEYDYGVCMEFHPSDKACRYPEARP